MECKGDPLPMIARRRKQQPGLHGFFLGGGNIYLNKGTRGGGEICIPTHKPCRGKEGCERPAPQSPPPTVSTFHRALSYFPPLRPSQSAPSPLPAPPLERRGSVRARPLLCKSAGPCKRRPRGHSLLSRTKPQPGRGGETRWELERRGSPWRGAPSPEGRAARQVLARLPPPGPAACPSRGSCLGCCRAAAERRAVGGLSRPARSS